MECYTIGVEVFPMETPPPPPPTNIPAKILALLKKYRNCPWRIKALARYKWYRPKFYPEYGPYEDLKPVKPDPGNIFYSENLSAPKLRRMYENKRLFGRLSKKLNKKFTKNIDRAWKSIHYFYRNRERLRKLKAKKRAKDAKKGKKRKSFSRTTKLAEPKPIHLPPPREKPKKELVSDAARLDSLASPKVYIIKPPRTLPTKVSPRAMAYEPTEDILRLATPLQRDIPPPIEIGKVPRSALKYKATPRIEALSVPKKIREKAKEEDDFDPWTISKTALKYKATPRILELAKPLERD